MTGISDSSAMSAGEDLVTGAASAAENPIIHATGTTGDPTNDRPNHAVNDVSNKEIGSKSPANVEPNTVNPLNDHASGSENPVIAQASVAETPRNEAGGTGADDSINDQLNGAKNPANNQAGGAETETFMNDQLNIAETSVNDQAGGGGKILAHSEADAIKNPLVDQPDAAENLVEGKADAIETPSNIKDTVETPGSNKIDRLPVEAKEILISLAGKWEDVLDASALQVIPLKGAMTNEVFQIKWPATNGETSRKVVVRIYGEGVDIFFDRDDEIRTFEYMSKNGQGPRLLGRFTNGRVEEFIHARVI